LKAGFLGVPEYSSGKIREGYGIRNEEAETKLKGKLYVGPSHVERPKPTSTIMLLVLQNIRKDVR
jgi:hypothetical protein